MKLGPQSAGPWTYLDSPTVTQTLRSCDYGGPEQIDISKADQVVRLQDMSEHLRSADFRQVPHPRHGTLHGTMTSGNPKYFSGEYLLPFKCSNRRGWILCEIRRGPQLATALYLPLLLEPSLISMRIHA